MKAEELAEITILPGAKNSPPKNWEVEKMAFGRTDLREILGEAYTDDIAKKLITLHRGVVDPLKDDLDNERQASTKWKAEADKLPGIQKELDDLKKEDYKAKYEKEHGDFEAYKGQVAKDAETAKVKAAYKKLLVEEQISEKTLDAVLAATDYSKIKLKDDGTLDGIEDLKKDIADKWGSFKVTTRQRGQQVDNPPPGGDNGGNDGGVRSMAAKWHERRFGAAPATNPQK